MSAPNTPKAKAVHPPTETPLPDREASTQQVCEWIKTWHKDHEVEVDEVTLTQVTWTGRWIHEQPPAQLETDIASWGVPQRRARMMVLDLVHERRHPTKFKPKWSDQMSWSSVMYPLVKGFVKFEGTFSKRPE